MTSLFKNAYREILRSPGRFLAILAIIVLGSGFFVGLRVSTSAMTATARTYLDETSFYDFSAATTLGLTQEDVDAFAEDPEVLDAEGSVNVEALVSMGTGTDVVFSVYSLPQRINTPKLVEGRMPQSPDECLADAWIHLPLGAVVSVSDDNDEDTLDMFAVRQFTVVGVATSPLYLNYERGSTSIGSGSVTAFCYVLPEAFDTDYFTSVYIRAADMPGAYTSGYDRRSEELESRLTDLADSRAGSRFDTVKEDAAREIADGQAEYDDGLAEYLEERADAEQELEDARLELEDAKKELEDGAQEIADARAELDDGWAELRDSEKELADARRELRDAKKELDDAAQEIADGWTEYNDGLAEFEKQRDEGLRELRSAQADLISAKAKLEDGEKEYDEGYAQYQDGLSQYESGLSDYYSGVQSLDDAEAAYQQGLKDYDSGVIQYEEGKAKLEASKPQLDEAVAQFNAQEAAFNAQINSVLDQFNNNETLKAFGFQFNTPDELMGFLETSGGLVDMKMGEGTSQSIITSYTQGKAALEAGRQQVEAAQAEYDNGVAALEASKRQLDAAKATLESSRQQIDSGRAELESAWGTLTDTRRQLDDAEDELSDARRELDDGWTEYNDGFDQYNEALEEYNTQLADAEAELADAKAELEDAEVKYSDGLAEYNDGLAQYNDGLRKYNDGKKELEDGEAELADAQADYDEGLQEYNDGLAEYNDAWDEARQEFADAEAELADAEQELADARQELADLEYPTAYLLGRWANVGYECFESDSSIVKSISAVFPLFFFLLAALICLTTVTRMVEEQRSQLGVLMALGYSRMAVMGKFFAYSGLATVVGGAAGILLGSELIPLVVWQAYKIMYNFSDGIQFYYDWRLSTLVFAAYVAAMLLVTWLTCRREINDVPANVLRPRAPKAGKRVLLERVPIIWNRLSFLWKVTVRNIFRYKSRVFMMILGVAGCTALMITGMGIRDSIQNVVDYQFTEISLYDFTVTFADPLTETDRQEFLKDASGFADGALFTSESSVTAVFDRAEKDVQLIIVDDDETGAFPEFVDLHRGSASIPFPGVGEAVINKGLAESLGIRTGDTLTIRPEEGPEYGFTVAGIYDNYIYNYVYVSGGAYTAATGEAPEINFAMVNKAEGVDVGLATAEILGMDNVLSASASLDLRERIGSMMESLIYIVLLTIVCAAALAFVVIYNLTNINIQERLREIATVKVLGFYDLESALYVLRENLILTVLGAAAGIPLGIALNAFVISRIDIDLISFTPRVLPPSYLLSVALTFLFSILVDILMFMRLKRINPAEALKAAE